MTPAAFELIDERWEVGVGVSAVQSFQQISLVNSIATTKGGGYVTHSADQVSRTLVLTRHLSSLSLFLSRSQGMLLQPRHPRDPLP